VSVELKPANFIRSFQCLKGNTRTSIIFEPLWGIPYALYSFYLSLYMKSQSISDRQIGFLISIGFIASIIAASFGGLITDRLGRRRTTVIFDLLAWPGSLLIYLISGNFWAFLLAQVVNSLSKVTAVSWNLMVVEDATIPEQVTAYNLINTVNICVGIFTPLAGIMIREMGIVNGERILIEFAVVSMSVMILGRHHYYRETGVGQQILHERRAALQRKAAPKGEGLLKILAKRPLVLLALCCSVLFNAYLPIGTYQSLYYAPFLTEALKLDKATIAILGGVNAAVMFIIFVFVIPRCAHFNRLLLMAAGAVAQIIALLMFITIPAGQFFAAILCVVLFAIGFGMTKPFMDAVLAEVTDGKERAKIYAFYNVAVSMGSAGMGFISGFLYDRNPALIYVVSIGILILCIGLLAWLGTLGRRQAITNALDT
jgi:MFS family permease